MPLAGGRRVLRHLDWLEVLAAPWAVAAPGSAVLSLVHWLEEKRT